jgi:hypothetical protein
MSILSKTRRRSFLKVGLSGLATGAVAPHLWIPTRARAALPVPSDKDNHLVLINLDGGARSVPMFNAASDGRWNPYGVLPSAAEWAVGGVFANTQYTDTTALGMPAVPSITDIAADIAVMATVDHTPGTASGVGGHITARNYIASGFEQGGPGIMSEVMRHHKYYGAEANAFGVFPPVVVGGGDSTTPFAAPSGNSEPLRTNGFREFANQSGNGEEGEAQPGWARAFENGLDHHMRDTRSAHDRSAMSRLALGKDAVEHFRAVFTDPALKVADEPAAQKHGITNQELGAVFGTTDFGRNAALATRFLLEGSTAVLIGDPGAGLGGNWDHHSGETNLYMNLCRTLERVLCGFNYMLKRMDHPAGGSYWDHTVVAIISEFGRDNLQASGYNSAGGSDHVGGPGSRYQAYCVMGGPVGAKGAQLGTTNSGTMELVGNQVYSTTDYLATLLAFLDIDPTEVWPSATPIGDLW